mmetsp:Transcript_16268/g.56825  ORF Transcript_16268/g.56825 Transcript_16268/m.56825 type:complete len:257 (-) Transcript_16268:3815-4585(-)
MPRAPQAPQLAPPGAVRGMEVVELSWMSRLSGSMAATLPWRPRRPHTARRWRRPRTLSRTTTSGSSTATASCSTSWALFARPLPSTTARRTRTSGAAWTTSRCSRISGAGSTTSGLPASRFRRWCGTARGLTSSRRRRRSSASRRGCVACTRPSSGTVPAATARCRRAPRGCSPRRPPQPASPASWRTARPTERSRRWRARRARWSSPVTRTLCATTHRASCCSTTRSCATARCRASCSRTPARARPSVSSTTARR